MPLGVQVLRQYLDQSLSCRPPGPCSLRQSTTAPGEEADPYRALGTIGAPWADAISARITQNPQQMPDIRRHALSNNQYYRSVPRVNTLHIRPAVSMATLIACLVRNNCSSNQSSSRTSLYVTVTVESARFSAENLIKRTGNTSSDSATTRPWASASLSLTISSSSMISRPKRLWRRLNSLSSAPSVL